MPGNRSEVDDQFNSVLAKYWNIPFLKSNSLTRSLMANLISACSKNGRPSTIISYNPSIENVVTGLFAQEHLDIPWIDLCADSYDPGIGWAKYPNGARNADGHIFLSYHAFSSCPFPRKFHLDGGIDTLEIRHIEKRNSGRIALYSGMMSKWGGVDFLLRSFDRITYPDVELWVCGHGQNSSLKRAAKRDSRIRCFGLVSEARLDELSRLATIFVNPRPSGLDGNSMNFPSKILQYLSYGKPIVSTWTPGLSEDYRNVLFVLKDETEDCLAETITRALFLSNEQRTQIAARIGEFANDKRNWDTLAEKFLNWVEQEIIHE